MKKIVGVLKSNYNKFVENKIKENSLENNNNLNENLYDIINKN
jgi:hypothetical protein